MSQMHKPNDAHSTANQRPRREIAFARAVRVPIVRFVGWRCEAKARHRLASITRLDAHCVPNSTESCFSITYSRSSCAVRTSPALVVCSVCIRTMI